MKRILASVLLLLICAAPLCAFATSWNVGTPVPAATGAPFVPPTPAPTQASIHIPENAIGTIYVTNNQSANVRAKSTSDSAKVGLVNPGERYFCVGVADNGWFEIIYPTGQNGFVSNKLVRLDPGYYNSPTYSYIIGYVMAINDEASRRVTNGPSAYAEYMGYAEAARVYPCVGVTANGWYAILREEKQYIIYLSPQGGMWVEP